MPYTTAGSNSTGGLHSLVLDIYDVIADNSSNETDYHYNRQDALAYYNLAEYIPSGIVYAATFLLGVVGNALVIFSICRFRRMQNVTNTFLTSLASADLILILICVPIKFAKFLTYTWEFGEFLCKFVHYMMNVSAICSVLTLTSMSVERYYAILHPMKAKYTCTPSRARRVVLAVWVLSFILSAPILIGQIMSRVGPGLMFYWCEKSFSKKLYSQLYEIYMLLLVLIIPLIVMSTSYCCICRELWIVTSKRVSMTAGNGSVKNEAETSFSNNKKQYSLSQSGRKPMLKKSRSAVEDDKTRKQVIKMLATVVILFALCWAPFLVDNVMTAFELLDQVHYDHLKVMRMWFSLMTYMNSCVNPVVYAFMSKNFRESFKYALCSCIQGKNYGHRHRYGHTPSFQTRTTSLSRGVSLKTEFEMDKSQFSESIDMDSV
ncbi:QRFP-like peptide receptor [Tubulanus polymorphus]|uniref:QRFP-like peptide receptor n=1 Tax=Tubulanus polymorphus TaxID=672921 RepID=UPI003DA518ED